MPLSFPKWRHHPEKESVIVHNEYEESYLAPDDQGWHDFRPGQEPVESDPTPEVEEASPVVEPV